MSGGYHEGYYEGAYDALTEAMSEVQAAWVAGHPGIEREHYDSDTSFWAAVMKETLATLQASYKSDGEFVRRIQEARPQP